MKKYSHRKVVRKGKKDGRDWKWKFWPFKEQKPRVPKADQSIPAQLEVELIRAAENDISLEAEKWKESDRKLKPKYCEALAELEEAERREIKESGEAVAAQSEFAHAKEKYEEISQPALNPKWRNFWLILIAIAEFPLNGVVFAIFGAGRIETYVIAGSLCIAIPLIAHFFGSALRQENKTRTDLAFIITMPVTMLLILSAIAFIRAKFFEATVSQQLIGITLTPTQMTILFIIINIAIFLVALIVSYEGSHSDKRYFNTVYKRYNDALKRLRKEATEAEQAGRILAEAEEAYQTIRQYRQKSHEKFVQQVSTIQQTGEWLVSSYRAANMRVRPDTPSCFLTEPKNPEIPHELLQLDWQCEGHRTVDDSSRRVEEHHDTV